MRRATARQAVLERQPVATQPRPIWWLYAIGMAAVYLSAYLVYSPALHGGFVFDDLHLPFVQPAATLWGIKDWIFGPRPLTMITYWANLHMSGLATYPYHLWNVLFHGTAAILLFFAVRRILELARTDEPNRTVLSIFASSVFLLHPIQTEGVAYIAGRSEDLSALFFFAAWCVFLYRRSPAISWLAAAGILSLFVASIASKEHTAVLPAVLLLTDYFFNPGFSWKGARNNWRLYAPILVAGLAGAVIILRYISRDTVSIGFNLQEFTWYQYLFTQFRVFFAYIGLFLFPYWQTIDYDFAVSHNILEHGAILYLAGVLALAGAAFHYRRRFPLASYGFFVFCLILLPTSSFVPLKDVIADRRLYLPIVGLILIALEFLRRWKASTRTLAATLATVSLVFAVWTYNRSHVWSSAVTLWEDAAQKAPNKQRVQFGVAVAYFQANRCREAADRFARAAAIQKPDYMVLMDWGMAYDCNNQHDLAMEKMNESIALHPSAQAWANVALLELKQGQMEQPLAALDKAQALDPAYINTYVYRGMLQMALGKYPQAQANLEQALAIDSTNPAAIEGMKKLQAAMSAPAR